MSMADRIRALRKELSLSQPELAKRCQISQPSLSNIESGKTVELAGTTLANLCRVLRSTPDYIVFGRGPAHPESVSVPEHVRDFMLWYAELPTERQQQIFDIARVVVGPAVPDAEVEERMPATKRRKKA